MKKIVLVDGNNLMFRSYYATAYSGNILKNSKGFPTNALYGFVTMINKIVNEEIPDYMAVAFDVGKNFRKAEFSFYKEGRQQTPDELKMQMPVARKILDAMGIKYLELEPYEADDIIGTLVKKCEMDKDFSGTIISSDKDLLQLINFETDIKLLKQTGYIRYNEETFKEAYGIDPIRIIDLKGLMGDSSDNIPGVKGIGEKTALKLLHEYESIEGIYENIDKIKGSVHDKLVNDKENAFMSKKIATIYKDVPLDISLEDLKYDGVKPVELRDIYNELEFTSLLKTIDAPKEEIKVNVINVNDEINVVLENNVALYIQTDNEVYTYSSIIGAFVCDSKYTYYFSGEYLDRLRSVLKDKKIATYDHKKNLYLMDLPKADDLMLMAYLLGYQVKDDISSFIEDIIPMNALLKNRENIISNGGKVVNKIYNKNKELQIKLDEQNLRELYENIELPLINVLSKMEKEGIICDDKVLHLQGENIDKKIIELTDKIQTLAGEKFNIASPKQLGEILFEKLEIGKGKKNKIGYKTDADTLEKLYDAHEIIPLILEYRELAKLKNTYIDGLCNYIHEDGKVHSVFKQTVARTGRLSSTEPNLQNIPIKEELGRKIRMAFLPTNDLFLSCDYSQIELRILAHIANSKTMIDTFNNDEDIHTKVAADIHSIDVKDVTKNMRSKAKAVIFGIVYGISGFGLGDNLHISKKEADEFIQKYYNLYPEVKEYMAKEIEFAKKNGYVLTLFNRKRVIDEVFSSNYMIRQSGERMAINTPIQGTSADIIKMAMIEVDKKFIENNLTSKLVLQIHDELIVDVKKSEEEIVKNIVKATMENIVKLSVPLKVSLDTGENLYEIK